MFYVGKTNKQIDCINKLQEKLKYDTRIGWSIYARHIYPGNQEKIANLSQVWFGSIVKE